MSKDIVSYLLNLLGHKAGEFQDIMPYDISAQLTMMLTEPLTFASEYISDTTIKRAETEDSIKRIYTEILAQHQHFNNHFEVENHHGFVIRKLTYPLPEQYVGYDVNHTWMLYWLINSAVMLNYKPLSDTNKKLAVEKISGLVVHNGKGGISGGKNQLGHLASTYAAVLTLVALEEYQILAGIRDNLHEWILSLKQADGSFIMHYHGETDARSNYCALVIGSLLNFLDDEFCRGCLDWIKSCQTYEGGFSGVPGTEAHGGYTFCAVACYFILLGNTSDFPTTFKHNMKFDLLLRWLTSRQLQLEGGLSGRTNKLVDACYSFWVGGVFSMVESIINTSILDKDASKIYLLNCAQHTKGGFKDKPDSGVDFYHTNYSLLGLSCVEHNILLSEGQQGLGVDEFAYNFKFDEINDDTNILPVNPIFGLVDGYAERCRQYFSK